MQHNSSAWEACSEFSSVAQSCLTLCNPMDYSTPGLPVHHQLPELAQTHVHQVGDAIQPFHPLSSLSPPAMRRISMRYILDGNYHEHSHWEWPYYQCTSFTILFLSHEPTCLFLSGNISKTILNFLMRKAVSWLFLAPVSSSVYTSKVFLKWLYGGWYSQPQALNYHTILPLIDSYH